MLMYWMQIGNSCSGSSQGLEGSKPYTVTAELRGQLTLMIIGLNWLMFMGVRVDENSLYRA